MDRHEQALTDRRNELSRRLRRIESDLDHAPASDISERAIEIEDGEVMEGLGQQGLAEIKAIDAALERVHKGTYGTCARCGEPISEARLAAVPYAALCEECIRV